MTERELESENRIKSPTYSSCIHQRHPYSEHLPISALLRSCCSFICSHFEQSFCRWFDSFYNLGLNWQKTQGNMVWYTKIRIGGNLQLPGIFIQTWAPHENGCDCHQGGSHFFFLFLADSFVLSALNTAFLYFFFNAITWSAMLESSQVSMKMWAEHSLISLWESAILARSSLGIGTA